VRWGLPIRLSSIGPTASFQYTYVSFDGFTESGSLAPLKFSDQHVDSIRTAFGTKASYDWKIGNVLIRPELRAAWQHEYGNSSYSIVASFANGAGNSFSVSVRRSAAPACSLGLDLLCSGATAFQPTSITMVSSDALTTNLTTYPQASA
jgi:outer membrane autotransporter protein